MNTLGSKLAAIDTAAGFIYTSAVSFLLFPLYKRVDEKSVERGSLFSLSQALPSHNRILSTLMRLCLRHVFSPGTVVTRSQCASSAASVVRAAMLSTNSAWGTVKVPPALTAFDTKTASVGEQLS